MLQQVTDVTECICAQQNLERWLHVAQFPEHRFSMPPARAQEMVDATKSAIRAMEALRTPFTPKFHLWLHISASALSKGLPNLWGCWLDGDLNSMPKQVSLASLSCKRELWPRRVIHAMDLELARRFP